MECLKLLTLAKSVAKYGFPRYHPDLLLFRAFTQYGRWKPLAQQIGRRYFFEISTFLLLHNLQSTVDWRLRRWYTVAIKERDANAFQMTQQKLGEYETVYLLWGGLHYPGIKKRLLAEGYRVQRTDWLTIFS
jgi:hypothetical protein